MWQAGIREFEMQHPRIGQRVIVVGPPGSGKTTVAARLASKINAPRCELDRVFWRSNLTRTDRDEGREHLRRFTDAPRWVIDGNYLDESAETTWPAADTIVWLDLPRRTTARRTLTRTLKGVATGRLRFKGKRSRTRALRLLRFSWQWHSVYARQYDELLRSKRWPHLSWIRLRSTSEVRRLLSSL